MQNDFVRLNYNHRIEIKGSKERVFGLLCLVRESEWLPGFSSETIYSESGVSELDSVFKTGKHDHDERLWTIPIYEKDKFIEMVYFQPEVKIVIIKLTVSEKTKSETYLDVQYILTSISEEGNKELKEFTKENYKRQINTWQLCFNHLFLTGHRIPESMVHHP